MAILSKSPYLCPARFLHNPPMKFIILAVVLFLLYRYFNGSLLPPGPSKPSNQKLDPTVEEDEGEYIDYEEVD